MEQEDNDYIIVGKKDFLSYVKSIDLLMRRKGKNKISLKARGKYILKAIDLAESCKNRYLLDLHIKHGKIITSTVHYEKNNEKRSVSTIEIDLKRSS